MNYIFECCACGKYLVDRETFEAFIGPQMAEELNEQIMAGIVVGATVHFNEKERSCCMCAPHATHRVSVSFDSALYAVEC